MQAQAKAIQQMQEAIFANQLLMGTPGGIAAAAVVPPAAVRPPAPVARGEMPFEARQQLLGRLEKLPSAELQEALGLAGVDHVPGALCNGELDLGALDSPRLWRLKDFCDVAARRSCAGVASTRRAITHRHLAAPRSRKRKASCTDLAEAEAEIEERLAKVRAARAQLLGGATAGSSATDEWLDEPRPLPQEADEGSEACATTDADVETDADMPTDADALLCQFDIEDSDGEDAW